MCFLWLWYLAAVASSPWERQRETVEPLENMNWQKEEGYHHLHHCIQVHQEKPEWNLSLPLSLRVSFHHFLSPVLYFSISPFYISLSSLPTQQLTLHTQAQTEISIHVLPRSPATPTNGSMQLACTHSKRSFEYSSANSCIHWYLKCSGFARAPQLMVHLTKSKTKNKKRFRGQGSRQFLLCSYFKSQTSDWRVFASFFSSQKTKACTLSVFFFFDPLITTYIVLKVCRCQNPPDRPLHISVH